MTRAELTRDQLSTATDICVWIQNEISIHWPGALLTATCIATAVTCSKVRAWRERRAIQHIEHFANHPANRPRKEKP